METISFELDGQTIDALPEETILQAADRLGIADIPRLCYKKGYRSDGNCRSVSYTHLTLPTNREV